MPELPPEDAERLKQMRRNARSYANSLMRTRRLTEASQQHEDRMLTWSAGLMGAALFALPALLSTSCGNVRGDIGLVGAPWAGGVMLALLGRVAGGWHRDSDALHFAAKWGGLQALVLRSNVSPESLGQDILKYMNDETDQLKDLKTRTTRLNRWAASLYYSTLLAFGIGVAITFWKISTC